MHGTNLINTTLDILDETKNSKSDYVIYHDTMHSVERSVLDFVKKSPFDIDKDDWFHSFTSGPGKPSEGKTTPFHIRLLKGGKEQKKQLHFQVFNRGNNITNRFELNMYIL